MSNNELLLNISNMLSNKLEPVNQTITEIKSNMYKIQETVDEMQDTIHNMKDTIHDMQDTIHDMQDDITELKNRVKKIELTQENIILPRLQNIEECYLSTFERYRRYADEFQATKQDVDVLKCVVADHSVKLQRIS